MLLRFVLVACITLAFVTSSKAGSPQACLPREVKAALAHIERNWGRVTIVSTFRKNAFIAGSGNPSYHASCRAVDFHPRQGSYRAVLNYLRTNWRGGLGTYLGRMHHLHIDSGPYARFHKRV